MWQKVICRCYRVKSLERKNGCGFLGWALYYLKGPFKSVARRLKSEQVKLQRALDVVA